MLLGWIFSPFTGFPPNGRFGKSAGQSIHGGGNKQDKRRISIFGKIGDAGGIIQGDNSTRHCFIINDLISMNFFKKVMIMKLKMCTASKVFGKIYLKAIRDTFFQHVVWNQERDRVRHEVKWEDSIFWW